MIEEKKKAKSYILRLLAARDYPSVTLIQKLTQKGFSEEVIEEMITWVKEQGFVDDERYLQALINQEVKIGRSPIAIRWKLRMKGLPSKSVDIDEETQKEQIRKLLPKLSSDKRKAMASLYRRGFTSELIAEIFRTII